MVDTVHLRELAVNQRESAYVLTGVSRALREAADEVDKLRAEVHSRKKHTPDFRATRVDAFTMRTMCVNCGKDWGDHIGVRCPIGKTEFKRGWGTSPCLISIL
jgi:hypothetical protein